MEEPCGVVFRTQKRNSQARGHAVYLHLCTFFCKLPGNHLWNAIKGSIEALLFICSLEGNLTICVDHDTRDIHEAEFNKIWTPINQISAEGREIPK
jgi:hypothetical protein